MTKLERARLFLKEVARPGLRVISLSLLAASSYATASTFNVTGTFDTTPVDTLSGTITIDIVGSGGILGEDLTVDPIVVNYNFNGPLSSGSGFIHYTISSSTAYYYQAIFAGSNGSTLTLDFDLGGAGSFVGYTGGSLCSDADTSCNGASSTFADPFNLSIGQVAPSTPEPSTVLLSLAGGAFFEALRRRKRRA
jgi:hypothetical protein